ncbi:MAG: hypothetical protein J6S57_00450 [Alphaproteobacteria bacterium]|nr:hypothetical protein [Alphaproteobacteria bacterium]
MKRIPVAFIGFVLTVVPMLANGDPTLVTPGYSDPTQTTNNGATLNVSNTAPQYAIKSIYDDEQEHIASTAYVKGAYNSAIRSVNRVANDKQEKLNSGNGGNVTVGSGPFVTGFSANAGAVTVTTGEITVPVGNPSSPTGRAVVWIE